MTPNSVSLPVPTTIPEPLPDHERLRREGESPFAIPLRTRVPMKAMQCLSPNALPPPSPCVSSPSPLSHCSVFFLDGRVSPVNADSSISSDTAVIRRMSAGILSPTENVTRSPGKRVLARGESACPFLKVRAVAQSAIWLHTLPHGSNAAQAGVSDAMRHEVTARLTLFNASKDFSDRCSWTKPTADELWHASHLRSNFTHL